MTHTQSNFYRPRFLFEFIISDIKRKYLGSSLGFLWAVLYPLLSLIVMVSVLKFGLKLNSIETEHQSIPYLFWPTVALLPWFFFSDALVSSSSSYMEYAFLLKKLPFPVAIIPSIKIASSLFIHLILLVCLILFLYLSNWKITFYSFQLLYYAFALTIFLIGVSLILSSLIIFYRDLLYLTQLILQFGIWLTPIFWDVDKFSSPLKVIIYINPLVYIVQGYRDSLLTNNSILNHPIHALYFWSVTILLLSLGSLTLKRLRPYFSDVL